MYAKYIKSTTGYMIAVFCIFIAFATFFGNAQFSRSLIKTTGLSISPWYTGGDVMRTIDHGDFQTNIHKPVFRGLFSDRKTGFVQIDWVEKTSLPIEIIEDIDIDNDTIIDARLEYNTKSNKAMVRAINPDVVKVEKIFKRKNGVTVRIRLKKHR